jgi:hypothetical protein
MGSAFAVLSAFYRPAIGELAAIAKAAVHIELPTMGVAIPLYHRAGVAALQPEVGPRGRRRSEASREGEHGGRNGQFHVPSFPLTKDVKRQSRRPAIYNLLEKAGAALRTSGRSHPSGASAARSPTRHASNTCGGARLLRPSAKASTYASGPCQKTISGSTLITAAITRLTSPGTQGIDVIKLAIREARADQPVDRRPQINRAV